MRRISELILAARYARAFGNVHGWKLSSQEFEAIVQAIPRIQYWVLNRFFNARPGDSAIEQALIKVLMKTLHLPHSYESLIQLLVAHKRIGLLKLVFMAIIEQYDAYHNLEHFRIISAKPLAENDIELVKKWLTVQCDKKISIAIHVDPTLGAGLILQSRNYRWEYTLTDLFTHARHALLP